MYDSPATRRPLSVIMDERAKEMFARLVCPGKHYDSMIAAHIFRQVQHEAHYGTIYPHHVQAVADKLDMPQSPFARRVHTDFIR